MHALKHWRGQRRFHGNWSGFAGMEWQAYYQELMGTLILLFMPEVFPVPLGLGERTFTKKDYMRFINSLSRR